MSAGVDAARAVSDQFLELIFTDPELFEAAVAVIEASWSGHPPPASIPPARTRGPTPGGTRRDA